MKQRNILSTLGLMLFVMATMLVAIDERPSTASVIVPAYDGLSIDLAAPEVAAAKAAESHELAGIDNKVILSTVPDGRAILFEVPGQLALNQGKGLWHNTDITYPRHLLADIPGINEPVNAARPISDTPLSHISTRE